MPHFNRKNENTIQHQKKKSSKFKKTIITTSAVLTVFGFGYGVAWANGADLATAFKNSDITANDYFKSVIVETK